MSSVQPALTEDGIPPAQPPNPWRPPTPQELYLQPSWKTYVAEDDQALPAGEPLSTKHAHKIARDQFWVLYGTSRLRASITAFLRYVPKTMAIKTWWMHGIHQELVSTGVPSNNSPQDSSFARSRLLMLLVVQRPEAPTSRCQAWSPLSNVTFGPPTHQPHSTTANSGATL